MRDSFIIIPFVLLLPFQLPIPAEAGICLAGAASAAWFIAFRASRGPRSIAASAFRYERTTVAFI